MTSAPRDSSGESEPEWEAVLTPLTPQDPREIGGFLTRARIGEGGMGTVYLSYTPGGRPVALKQARAEFGADLEFRRRFAREVAIAARVQGLFTAPVVAADADARLPWLATAYVAAPSLAVAIARHGPLPVESILMLVAGVAEALESIHGAGVIHRDLKPGNIILATDGPRVIDFGISRAVEGSSSRTHPSVLFGTPAFMAPERVRGDDLGPPGDVFALGSTAYYAATGELPFGVDSAVFHRIAYESPNWRRCPDQIRAVLARCVEKAPGDRPRPAELIELCRQASTDERLRVGEGWLPATVAGEITRYQLAPLAAVEPDAGAVPSRPEPSPAAPAERSTVEVAASSAPAPAPAAPVTVTVTAMDAKDDAAEGEISAAPKRPVWVPWIFGGSGAVLVLLVIGIAIALAGASPDDRDGRSAADQPVVSALASLSASASASASGTGPPPAEVGPSAAAPSGTGPAGTSSTGVWAEDTLWLYENVWDRDSLAIETVPLTVTDASRDFHVLSGKLLGNRLAQWSGPGEPTAAGCAQDLRSRPVGTLDNHDGVRFCALGVETRRIAAGRVESYDNGVSVIRFTVWDQLLED
ncbi:serine/threonine-protein kinase [Parafrankia sp. FMc2]|uniref:serine/threonine-protein kinase n=1 Tax=Parafrankia sp. FMc2 TaxID=3233196 RepID=UPI0034D75112